MMFLGRAKILLISTVYAATLAAQMARASVDPIVQIVVCGSMERGREFEVCIFVEEDLWE